MRDSDVGETGLKRALNPLVRIVTCCHLQHISKLNCTVDLQAAIIHKGGLEMNLADLCNRAPIITAWGLGPAQGPPKRTAFKVCLVHSRPLLQLNCDLH